MVRRNPPKLQSSFAQASEDTRIPPRSGDRGFLRRRGSPGEKRRDRLLILKDSSPVLNQREMITPVIGRVDLFYNLLIFKNDRFGPDRFGP